MLSIILGVVDVDLTNGTVTLFRHGEMLIFSPNLQLGIQTSLIRVALVQLSLPVIILRLLPSELLTVMTFLLIFHYAVHRHITRLNRIFLHLVSVFARPFLEMVMV